MWIPVVAIRSLFPQGLLTYFSEAGYTEEGPTCGSCTQSPNMRQQVIAGVEIDRCLYCLGLWLDGGELYQLGGGAEGAIKSTTCDMCGVGLVASESRPPTLLGSLCRLCRNARMLEHAASTDPRLAPAPAGITRHEVDGATVQFAYDVDADGEETLFEFRGELRDTEVRGSITHEDRLTSLMRLIGFKDVELGIPEFDHRFLVKAELEEPMRRWLATGTVLKDLLRLDSEGGCTVQIDRGLLVILGEQAPDRPVPHPELEEAAERIYCALRRAI